MNFEICPVRLEHVPGFHHVLGSVARERRFLMLLDAPPLQSTEQFVKKVIENDHPFFVALSPSGEVIGWCNIMPAGPGVHAHVGRLGMGLEAGFRGQGLGRRLLEPTLWAARRIGLQRIELTVYADNIGAIELYRNTGFETEGRQRQSAQLDGRFVDVLMMARLDPPS